MDPKIKEHADNIYLRQRSSAADRFRAAFSNLRVAFTRDGTAGLLFSGSEFRRVQQLYIDQIDALITGRLQSFIEAFKDADAQPTEEDFTQIWNCVLETKGLQIQSAARALEEYVRRRHGTDAGLLEQVTDSTGQSHDRALQEFKVWRSRSRLEKPPAAVPPSVSVTGRNVQIGSLGGAAAAPVTQAIAEVAHEAPREKNWVDTARGRIVISVIAGLLVLAFSFFGRRIWNAVVEFATGQAENVQVSSGIRGIWAGRSEATGAPVFYEFRPGGIVLLRQSADDQRPQPLKDVRWSVSGHRVLIELYANGAAVDTWIGEMFADEIIGRSSKSESIFPGDLKKVR